MPFTKGKSGNPEGRRPGAKNRVNAQLREMIGDFLTGNFNKVIEDFDLLPPRDRVKLYCELLQYGLPRLQAVQLETEFDRLTDSQLDQIIDELKMSEQ